MDSSKTKKREAFLAFARRVGGVPTSALGSADPLPEPSSKSQRAARLMVGSLSPGSRQTIERVAGMLDTLKELESASAKKRVHG
jgi:hypothetical protein